MVQLEKYSNAYYSRKAVKMKGFKDLLNQVITDMNLTRAELAEKTGISKASISYYLSGKIEPSEKKQTQIAISLGLPSCYFQDTVEQSLNCIEKLLPEQVAKIMGMSKETIRIGLQQGVFSWGYAIHTSEKRWVYFINKRKFEEKEGVKI